MTNKLETIQQDKLMTTEELEKAIENSELQIKSSLAILSIHTKSIIELSRANLAKMREAQQAEAELLETLHQQ